MLLSYMITFKIILFKNHYDVCCTVDIIGFQFGNFLLIVLINLLQSISHFTTYVSADVGQIIVIIHEL